MTPVWAIILLTSGLVIWVIVQAIFRGPVDPPEDSRLDQLDHPQKEKDSWPRHT